MWPRLQLLFVFLLTICSVVIEVSAEPQTQPSIFERLHTTTQLPTGGKFVDHPQEAEVRYYFVNQWMMWRDKDNVQKQLGLYKTDDAGESWRLHCRHFEFKELFIHPDTGQLFCIIEYEWLDENKAGFLVPHYANKALLSDDGKRWKDISGEKGHLGILEGIMADPDNPGRICLFASGIRPYILQAKNDQYSDWTWYRAWDWPHRAKNDEGR